MAVSVLRCGSRGHESFKGSVGQHFVVFFATNLAEMAFLGLKCPLEPDPEVKGANDQHQDTVHLLLRSYLEAFWGVLVK